MNKVLEIMDVNEVDFQNNIIEASEDKLVIVDFWAPWCEPCKQLTPILEKVVKDSQGKVILAKVNIDENQQIASQLRIQSIPAVFAFKNKQIVDAFQGVLPEKKLIEFLEKNLGEKLIEDYSEFYTLVEEKLENKQYSEAANDLVDFISNKPKDEKAINLYIICLSEMGSFEDADTFIASLDDETLKHELIKSAINRFELKKNNSSGESLDEMLKKLSQAPNDLELILKTSDKYFSNNRYDEAFNLLLINYPKNKNGCKNKFIEYFDALGSTSEVTVLYRKKLSKIMFS